MKKFSGLSAAEVEERVSDGLVNTVLGKSSRSVRDILRANILTRFNALLTVLAVAVIAVDQSPFNALFGLAMIINSGVGIFQELKAKRTLDKLAILSAPRVSVIRGGRTVEIGVGEVVQGDLIRLKLGDQVVVDGPVLESAELEIDESLLTGESDPIMKGIDDGVLSGSIVVAGSGVMRAEKVGAASYSAELTRQAKKFQRASSELMDGTNRLLKWISWMLVIVAPILILGQLRVDFADWRGAIVHATAAIVGMIPEGLVLLTSAAFMLAVVQLARRKVLVQQMPAVETLARVDTLLLDKTGTLTEGNIRFEAVIVDDKGDDAEVRRVLATIASRAKSPTNEAIAGALKGVKVGRFSREVPFSSARKWSAIEMDGQGWIFGAPEVVLAGETRGEMFRDARELANSGKRVLALARVEEWPDMQLPKGVRATALVVLSERIRSDAAQTLKFFAEQGVDIKVISGDSPLTVGAVATAVGLADVKVFDARELPDPNGSKAAARKFTEIIEAHGVFGRVQPEQKRQIAEALQKLGHVVAMTGDGVNDALALKKADLGIAMNSGAAATKAVAEIVLMDNKFSHLPQVLSEGRRVIANIERVANLFIIKNVYSLVLALAVTVAGLSYPYLPAQMTVISVLSIGIPAFFFALAPNNQIYRPGFLRRVLRFAVPVGVVAAAAMFVTYFVNLSAGATRAAAGTSVSIVVMIIGAMVLVLLARPLRGWKLGLIAACMATFVAVLAVSFIAQRFRYELDLGTLPWALVIGAGAMGVVGVVGRVMGRGFRGDCGLRGTDC
jgi:cation-transporting ATPase E